MIQRIDASTATYAFANRFVNVVAALPNGAHVRTAGRCGGMAYSVLDHLGAGREVPTWPPALFAPGHVPPDGHVVAEHLRERQLDSFRTPSALRFVTWSVLPDGDVGPVAGVRTRTRRELAGVLRALVQGRPVVLGLVVARSPLRAGDNHQVVATGFRRADDGSVVLTLLDPNTPRREVTLREGPDGWRASNGRLWRGFFRHAYTPRTPPALPSASRRPTARVRAGAPVRLAHVATGLLLVADGRTPALRLGPGTPWVPQGADGPLADGAAVRLVTADGAALSLVGGALTLATTTTDGPEAPVPTPDGADAWRVVVDGGGPWREGSRVRFVHAATGALLQGSAQGPATTWDPDASTWWTVATA